MNDHPRGRSTSAPLAALAAGAVLAACLAAAAPAAAQTQRLVLPDYDPARVYSLLDVEWIDAEDGAPRVAITQQPTWASPLLLRDRHAAGPDGEPPEIGADIWLRYTSTGQPWIRWQLADCRVVGFTTGRRAGEWSITNNSGGSRDGVSVERIVLEPGAARATFYSWTFDGGWTVGDYTSTTMVFREGAEPPPLPPDIPAAGSPEAMILLGDAERSAEEDGGTEAIEAGMEAADE